MADKLNLSIDAGATFSIVVTWKDPNGTPIDLTGYSARMKLKDTYGGNTLVSLTDSDGITLGGSAGTVTVTISDSQTAAIGGTDHTKGVYDLEVESAGGVTTRLLEGRWVCSPEVTD